MAKQHILLVPVLAGLLFFGTLASASTEKARCHRRGCRFNVKQWRCVCPKRPHTRPRVVLKGGPMIRIPGGCHEAIRKLPGKSAQVLKICLTPYSIDKHEVTVDDYRKCVEAGACVRTRDWGARKGQCNYDRPGHGNHPLNCVTWAEAQKYCTWAGKSLPSEAQWYRAAGGTTGRLYPWGNDRITCERAVITTPKGYGCGTGGTHPVGSKPRGASPFGVLDMAGNVWEWLLDTYSRRPYLTCTSKCTNPVHESPGIGLKTTRGGSFLNRPGVFRLSYRSRIRAKSGSISLGFRCAR